MTNPHTAALQEKHAGLDGRIAEEAGRPNPDQSRLTELKRQKLRIKQEIAGEA